MAAPAAVDAGLQGLNTGQLTLGLTGVWDQREREKGQCELVWA